MRPHTLLLICAAVVLVLAVMPQPAQAIDGDVSSASISSFSETLLEDKMFAPDSFYNSTPVTASAGGIGASTADGQENTYTATQAYGGLAWAIWGSTDFTTEKLYAYLNFTAPANADGFKVSVYAHTDRLDATNPHDMFLYSGTSWVDYGDITLNAYSWINTTAIYDPDYWSSNTLRVFLNSTTNVGTNVVNLTIDYAQANFYIRTLDDSDHYSSSFSDVSDWTYYVPDGSDSFTTDSDVGSMVNDYAGGTDSDYIYSNTPSFTAGGRYFEVRYRLNTTSVGSLLLEAYPSDSLGGSAVLSTSLTKTTSWTTFKVYEPDAFECVAFMLQTTSVDARLYVDYLRVSDETEAGWQHTGETTQAISNDAEAGFSYTTSTDADVLSCNITRTSGSDATFVETRVLFDTTTTVADLERDYYPFWAAQVKVTRSSAASTVVYANLFADGYNSLVTSSISALADWTTLRANHKASTTADSNKFWRIGGYLTAVGDWIMLQVDYVKAYGLANFTTTFTGAAVGDVAYVSSNALVIDKSSATLFQFDRDPAISVASTSYQVWNITTNAKNAVGISTYIAAWTTVDDESRGAMPTGITTDIRIRADGDCTVSAVRFIADATAPTCVRSNIAPTEPSDDETVTLSAVVTDPTEVYKVWFVPVTHPTGWSHSSAYSATEATDNLWTYTFTSLQAGYYCFKAVGNDGANNSTLIEQSYVDFTVREAEITVNTITLFGAGDDFDFVTWTFDINKDCTYTIREWSATYAAADTWTGSVAEGVRNIAWPKLSVTDDYVNFTVTFVNASLNYIFTSSYSMPKSTFYFESYLTGEGHKFNAEIVWCSGTLSKAATYTIYCDNAQVETGTVSMAVYVDTDKGLPKGQDHLYAFRFINGSQTLWVNCTYYSYIWNIDEPERGGTGVTTEEYWLRTLTVLTFIAVIIIGAGLGRKGDLPNYRGR